MKALVSQWQCIVHERFYETTDQNVNDALLSFDSLLSQAGITSLIDNIQLIVVCSSLLSFHKFTSKVDRRILRNTVPYPCNVSKSEVSPHAKPKSILPSLTASITSGPMLSSTSTITGGSAGSITLLQSDTSYQEQYVLLLNTILPSLAASSVYIIGMSIAMIARLTMYISQEQILDVITNIVNAFEIFLTIGEMGLLPACIAAIAIENICCGAIESGDSLHAGTVLALRALLQGLRASTKMAALMTAEKDFVVPSSSTSGSMDERLIDFIFYQRLFSSAIARIIRSQQLTALPRIDDVDLLSAIAGDIYSLISLLKPSTYKLADDPRKFCDELSLINVLHACRCNTIVQMLLRVPSYLSAILGLITSLLISCANVRSSRVANACRGFLTFVLLTDTFLSTSQVTDHDVHVVISALRSELTNEAKQTLKATVEIGYQRYLSNCGIPLRSARQLNIKAF